MGSVKHRRSKKRILDWMSLETDTLRSSLSALFPPNGTMADLSDSWIPRGNDDPEGAGAAQTALDAPTKPRIECWSIGSFPISTAQTAQLGFAGRMLCRRVLRASVDLLMFARKSGELYRIVHAPGRDGPEKA